MSLAASGQQFELRHGDQRAVIVEVGAALRSYGSDGRELLDGFDPAALADGARGQPLIPWPNRLRDGRYVWDGHDQQLPLTEPTLGNAIHGLVRWRNWTPVLWEPSRITLGLRLYPMPGYPFTLGLTIDYTLGDAGLRVTARAENLGLQDAPYGVGFHPYLTLGGPIDTARLTLDVERRLITDERATPVSWEPVAGTPFDFRKPREIGSLVLDTCFGGPARGADGRARVTLAQETADVTLWLGEAYDYLMVYSGDTLAPARRRRGLAVEPMSCAPNAFASGEGLVRLEPGATHEAEWGIER